MMSRTVTIDDVVYSYKGNYTIYQFCFLIGINLPCFCYHERLTIAGNCRICLVEVNGNLGVSCAMPLMPGMVIYTNSRRLTLSREGIMEFLLINHPLDCPICDQGGECDLQDISLVFGSDKGRFYESFKRSVGNLNCCGPLIKTVMTRCIHCTRCVRFLNEISGISDLGVLGRGFSMEIGTFIENHFQDALSGNIIDLCPVGALTSMPYAFTARPWELTFVETVDVLDAVGSSIRVDVAFNRVQRVLPVLNESVNEEWLTNKARFSYGSFSMQRNHYPRVKIFSRFVVVSWYVAIDYFFDNLFSGMFKNIVSFVGSFLDLDSMIFLKYFFNSFGCCNLNYQWDTRCLSDFRFNFLLSNTLSELEKMSFCFFFGLNLRAESPLLNSRLRKSFLRLGSNFVCFSFGLSLDSISFPVYNLGNSLKSFKKLIEGRFYFFSNFLFHNSFKGSISFRMFNFARNFNDVVSFFVGSSFYTRFDIDFFFESVGYLFKKVYVPFRSYVNIISNNIGRISFFEVGGCSTVNSLSFEGSSYSGGLFAYFLGTDELPFSKDILESFNFLVYQGSFFNYNDFFSMLNLIIPVSVYVENSAVYINVEGRLRESVQAIMPTRFVYSDLEVFDLLLIYRYVFFSFNYSIFDDFVFVMSFFNLLISYSCLFFFDISLRFLRKWIGCYEERIFVLPLEYFLFLNLKCMKYYNTLFSRSFNSYYTSDIYSRNSKTLALCYLKLPLDNFSINV